MPRRRGRAEGGAGSVGSVAATLVMPTASIVASALVGDAAFDLAPFTVSKSSSGVWGVPTFSVGYSSGSSWLSLSTARGSDGSVIVTPTITPGANTAGTKVATITVSDTVASNSPQTVTVTLTLSSVAPVISLSPSPLSMNVQDEAAGSAYTVTITNVGGTTASTPTIGTITGAGASYLTASAVSGSGPWTFTLTPNGTGGTPGTYAASVPVLLSGATTVNLTVSLTVSAQAQAQLALTAQVSDAAFTTGGATPADDAVTCYSSNGVSLSGPTIVSSTYSGVNTGWATLSLVGTQLQIAYDTSGSHAANSGMSLLTTVIQDANASNTVTHETYFKVNAAAATNILNLSSTSISVPVTLGSNAGTQTITVSNAGTGGFAGLGTITESLTSAVTWCSASYTAGTSTGTITLTFNTSGLSAGTYNVTLSVAASGASNSPRTVPIQVVVSAAAAVRLARYTLPVGVTQDSGTGAFSGVPTGVSASRPSNWNSAATATVSGTGTAGLADLQSKINAAAASNNPVIDIPAGVTLTGTLNLPPRTGTGYCVIRTNGYASLPAQGTRLNPTTHASYLATISTPNADPAIRTIQGANNYFFLGVQATTSTTSTTGESCFTLVRLAPLVQGTWATNHVAGQTNAPQNIYFHQCYLHGLPGTRKCIVSTSTFNVGIEDSYLDGARASGFEGQAINITYGGGSWYIKNNHLSGCGEHFMIGGGAIPFQADEWNTRDVYITGNYFAGRREWFAWSPGGSGTTAADGMILGFKNMFELKRGRRVLIVGNVFKTGGIAGQAGIQIVFKSDNNGNAGPTVSGTFDVHFLRNVVYDVQRCFNVVGTSSPAGGTTIPNDRHHIADNVFYMVNVPPNNGTGYLTEVANGASNIDIVHNTIVCAGAQMSGVYGMMTISAGTVYNLTVTDNIVPKGTYGINCSTGGFLLTALNKQVSGYTWSRNVMPGTWSTAEKNNMPASPSVHYYPASETAVGYTNYSGTTAGSFALSGGSYTATDTTTSPASAAGADITAVVAATTGVED